MSCDLSCCGFENRSVKSNCPWFCLSSIICPISLTLISPEHTAWPLLCELRDKIWHSSEQISIPRLRDWTSPNMQPTPKKQLIKSAQPETVLRTCYWFWPCLTSWNPTTIFFTSFCMNMICLLTYLYILTFELLHAFIALLQDSLFIRVANVSRKSLSTMKAF